MPRSANQANSGYALNPKAPCYECDMSRYNMRNYPNIKKLINKGIIYQNSINKLC